MILDEGKSRVFFYPNISSLKLDDEESHLKWCEWRLDDGQENMLIFLDFKVGGGLEHRMISEVFLLIILWEDKSKVLLIPKIFYELEDDWRMELSN